MRDLEKFSMLLQCRSALAIRCLVVQVMRVDTTIVESTKRIVKWKNASHLRENVQHVVVMQF